MLLALLVATGSVAGLAAWKSKTADRSQGPDLITETVKRGPLEISITERGNLESASNEIMVCLVEGDAGTGILSIVEEGKFVKKDDILVELDSAKLRQDALQQKSVVTQAASAMEFAKSNIEIQEAQNEIDMKAAEVAKEIAELEVKKYELGDYELERSTYDGEIKLATEDHLRATEKLNYTRRLIAKGYATQTELEADRIALKKAEVAMINATRKKNTLEEFTKERMLREKKAAVVTANLQVDRIKDKALAALAQCKGEYETKKQVWETERAKYEYLESQIKKCTMAAPRDGMVVYANMSMGNRSRNEQSSTQIYEGARVRERQPIIVLPDVSKMQVNARIHESKVGAVQPGQAATIRLDARAGKEFYGKVVYVSPVAASGSYPNINLKEYPTFIMLESGSYEGEQLKPGMTSEVEILIDRLASVLYVPLQAFVERGGRHFAWVTSKEGQLERREVKTGRASESMQEIVEDESLYSANQGLKEGEHVVLNPRTVLPKHVSQLEDEIPPLAVPQTGNGNGNGGAGPGSPSADPGMGGGPDLADARANNGGGGRRRGGRGGFGGGGRGGDSFGSLDKDSDGKLSTSELPENMREKMADLDTNGDKAIDRDEWRKARGGRGGSSGADEPATGS